MLKIGRGQFQLEGTGWLKIRDILQEDLTRNNYFLFFLTFYEIILKMALYPQTMICIKIETTIEYILQLWM